MNRMMKRCGRSHPSTQTGRPGFTLVECMVATLVLMITFSGILGFRYHSVLDAQRAEDQLLAARVAFAISEAWRGHRGATDFDPAQQGFDNHFQIQPVNADGDTGFSDSKTIKLSGTMLAMAPSSPSGSELLGSYQIRIEGRQFQADLSYKNAGHVPNTRILNVNLSWQDQRQTPHQINLATLTRTNS